MCEFSHPCSVHSLGSDTTESSTCLQNQRDIYTIRLLYLWPVFILSNCILCPAEFLSVWQKRNNHVLLKADLFYLYLACCKPLHIYFFSMYIKNIHTSLKLMSGIYFFCLCERVTQALMKAIKSEHRSVDLRTNSSHIRFSLKPFIRQYCFLLGQTLWY